MEGIVCAANGLRDVVAKFLVPRESQPKIEVPQEMAELLGKARKFNMEWEETVVWRHNTAVLIRWTVEQLKTLNDAVFELHPSTLNLTLFLLSLMQLSQLLRARAARETPAIPGLAAELDKLIVDTRQRCKSFEREVVDEDCRLISENTVKSKDALLKRRKDLVEQSDTLLKPLLELDLHCVFSNLLLNLRRYIRKTWQSREEAIYDYFRTLKILELILYYLSAATYVPVEPFLHQLFNDTLHTDRSSTFVYLLHDEYGLQKLSAYLQEASLINLETEMDFLSNLPNRKQSQIIYR